MKKLLPLGKLLVITSPFSLEKGKLYLLFIVTSLFLLQQAVHARVTPNDVYQQKRAEFERRLTSTSDPVRKEKVKKADELLNEINQKVCLRFEEGINKLSAIMDELRRRKGITETRVAFGGYDTPIKQADYYVTFAAEAVAYQRAKQYSSPQRLRSDLEVLKDKLLRAKTEVGKVLDSDK